MSLENMYNDAAVNTYVGTVRERQAPNAKGAQLVNFLDGQARTRNDGKADEFQTEFTRNEPGSYVAGGAQGVQRNGSLTRWTPKAFNLAFGGEGPPSLRNGYYEPRFRRAGVKEVHFYTPEGATFGNSNASAKSRLDSSPSGAPTF